MLKPLEQIHSHSATHAMADQHGLSLVHARVEFNLGHDAREEMVPLLQVARAQTPIITREVDLVDVVAHGRKILDNLAPDPVPSREVAGRVEALCRPHTNTLRVHAGDRIEHQVAHPLLLVKQSTPKHRGRAPQALPEQSRLLFAGVP